FKFQGHAAPPIRKRASRSERCPPEGVEGDKRPAITTARLTVIWPPHQADSSRHGRDLDALPLRGFLVFSRRVIPRCVTRRAPLAPSVRNGRRRSQFYVCRQPTVEESRKACPRATWASLTFARARDRPSALRGRTLDHRARGERSRGDGLASF